MKKSVHSESEMVKAVQELENGINTETVARNHGMDIQGNIVQLEEQVQRHGCKPDPQIEGIGRGEP